MLKWIVLAIVLLIVLLAAIVLIRAFMMQPTEALTAKIEKGDPKRSGEYAKRLSRMIRCETVSSRYDADRTKFYDFHNVLEELFPNIHKHCEKHVFNGSLLFKCGVEKARENLFYS